MHLFDFLSNFTKNLKMKNKIIEKTQLNNLKLNLNNKIYEKNRKSEKYSK